MRRTRSWTGGIWSTSSRLFFLKAERRRWKYSWKAPSPVRGSSV
jgi:hypothetical protein